MIHALKERENSTQSINEWLATQGVVLENLRLLGDSHLSIVSLVAYGSEDKKLNIGYLIKYEGVNQSYGSSLIAITQQHGFDDCECFFSMPIDGRPYDPATWIHARGIVDSACHVDDIEILFQTQLIPHLIPSHDVFIQENSYFQESIALHRQDRLNAWSLSGNAMWTSCLGSVNHIAMPHGLYDGSVGQVVVWKDRNGRLVGSLAVADTIVEFDEDLNSGFLLIMASAIDNEHECMPGLCNQWIARQNIPCFWRISKKTYDRWFSRDKLFSELVAGISTDGDGDLVVQAKSY